MLDRAQHELYLKRILRAILIEQDLSSRLALKGGTCLYLFHKLPRFSVDLDFNLIDDSKIKSFPQNRLNAIIHRFLTIDEMREKRNTLLWIGSFEKGKQKIKIEVSKRRFPDLYQVKQFYGLSVQTLEPSYLFAHKLCAITDRKQVQNRDLFDVWFMFENNFEINEDIIRLRTKSSITKYLQELERFIKTKVNSPHILAGLGELLDPKTKQWTKEHLLTELLFQIQTAREALLFPS